MTAPPRPPPIGALVTAHRIGPVLMDTVLSLLHQREVRLAALVILVDGCPQTRTTRAMMTRLLRAAPVPLRVLWRPHAGGVARARNRGLRWLLERCPEVTALCLLDGDDILPPRAIATALAALREAARDGQGRPGWVFTDKQNFGQERSFIESPERFRVTDYLAANLSQPSCVYARELFDAGLSWDENRDAGLEDWAFWLSAISAGFRGVRDTRGLLHYRQLRGARSSVNRRNDALSLPALRASHRDLFTPRAYQAAAARETPRFAHIDDDPTRLRLFTDPANRGDPRPMRWLDDKLAAGVHRAGRSGCKPDPGCPGTLLFCAEETYQGLLEQRLLRSVLALGEARLANGAARVDVLAGGAHEFGWTPNEGPAAGRRIASLVPAVPCAGDSAELLLPLAPGLSLPPAPEFALDGVQDRHAALIRREGQIGRARAFGGPMHIAGGQFFTAQERARALFGTGPLFPLEPAAGRRDIALLMPSEPGPAWGGFLDHLLRSAGAASHLTLCFPGSGPSMLPRLLRDAADDLLPLGGLARQEDDVLAGLLAGFSDVVGPPGSLDILARLQGLGPSCHLVLEGGDICGEVTRARGRVAGVIVADQDAATGARAAGFPARGIDIGGAALFAAAASGTRAA